MPALCTARLVPYPALRSSPQMDLNEAQEALEARETELEDAKVGCVVRLVGGGK